MRAELARGHPEVVRARPTQSGCRRARGARRPGGPASTPLTVERGLADTSGEGRAAASMKRAARLGGEGVAGTVLRCGAWGLSVASRTLALRPRYRARPRAVVNLWPISPARRSRRWPAPGSRIGCPRRQRRPGSHPAGGRAVRRGTRRRRSHDAELMTDAVGRGRGIPRASAEDPHVSSRSLSGPDGRSELAGLYLRVAETLERSARPAEQHAARNRSNGRPDGAAVELERASRAARRLGGPRARCANALSARLTWRSAGSVLSPAQQRVLGSRAARLCVSCWALLLGLVVRVRSCCSLHLPRFAAHDFPGGNA